MIHNKCCYLNYFIYHKRAVTGAWYQTPIPIYGGIYLHLVWQNRVTCNLVVKLRSRLTPHVRSHSVRWSRSKSKYTVSSCDPAGGSGRPVVAGLIPCSLPMLRPSRALDHTTENTLTFLRWLRDKLRSRLVSWCQRPLQRLCVMMLIFIHEEETCSFTFTWHRHAVCCSHTHGHSTSSCIGHFNTLRY